MAAPVSSTILTLSGVPTSRPELGGPTSVNVVNCVQVKENDPVELTLSHCKRAILFTTMMDAELFESGFVSKEKTYLPELEKTILDLAATKDLTQGVFFSLVFRKGDQMFARYFESGCFLGIMPSISTVLKDASPGTSSFFNYRIFTSEDLVVREQHLKTVAHGRSKSQTAVTTEQTASKRGPTRSRTTQYFDNKYEKCQQLFNQLVMLSNTEDVREKLELSSIIFHSVKKSAKPSDPSDRPLHVHGLEATESLCNVFKKHRIEGEHTVPSCTDFKIMEEEIVPTCVEDEFDIIISSISNYHWIENKSVTYVQYFSEKPEDAKKAPASLRNQLLYSFRKGYDDKYKQCIALLRKSAGRDVPSSSKSRTVSCEPPKKKRRIATRVKKVTSEVLAESLNLPGPFQSDNVSAPSKLFEDYTTQLIEDGTIVWQSHLPEKDVIVMNDYNPDTGVFQPMSFCHVTLHHEEQGSIFVHCSCSVYKLLLNGIAGPSDSETEPTHLDMSGITCMHSRFIQEHLLPNWNETLNPDYVAVSRKERKIKESLSDRNESIVKLSEAPHLVKFSVRGICYRLFWVYEMSFLDTLHVHFSIV